MLTVVLVVVLVAVAIGVVRSLRSQPAEPKPFGLDAFEAHGLGRASADVLKAVVATISFLGHPFTVVQEAEEARAELAARFDAALAQVEKNLEGIQNLEEDNKKLQFRAKMAYARSGELEALVAQVDSVVGGNK